MKLSKKTLITALLLVGCFATVFAQTQPSAGEAAPSGKQTFDKMEPKSMTSESTKDLFGTDVNDYLDVNEWSNVKPEKVFGFLSYEKTGDGALNFGVAVPVAGKFYLGTFFGGQVGKWESTKTTVKDGKTQDDTVTQTSDTNGWSGSVLFGFDNIGIIGRLSYTPKSPNSITVDKKAKTTTTKNQFDLETGLKAGMNIKGPNDMLFKTSAELALTSKVNKTIINTTGSSPTKDLTDDSVYTLWLKGGVGFDFAHNGTVTQGASFALNTGWNIYPTVVREDPSTKITTKQSGRLYDTIEFAPAWQLTYEPEGGKVVLKAKVDVPVTFGFGAAYDYTVTTSSGSQNKNYNIKREYQTGINFVPKFSLGLTYAPISKFRFNVGAEFHVPNFGWTITTTQHRNLGDGKPSAGGTDKTVTWTFNTKDGKLDLGTGFTWLISQNITFDAYWDFGGALKNFSINFSNPNIWDKLGKFIGTNIGFLLSVKL